MFEQVDRDSEIGGGRKVVPLTPRPFPTPPRPLRLVEDQAL